MDDASAPEPGKQPAVILTTPRLILRAATDEDVPIMWQRIFGDADVMRYVFKGKPMTEERVGEVVRKYFTFGEKRTGLAVLTEKPTDDIIGFAGLLPCGALGREDFEIGFVLARHAWGRGIATEIGQAQLAFGFEQLNCRRLLGLVHPKNGPSRHTLEKLGMSHIKKNVRVSGISARARRSVFGMKAEKWFRGARE